MHIQGGCRYIVKHPLSDPARKEQLYEPLFFSSPRNTSVAISISLYLKLSMPLSAGKLRVIGYVLASFPIQFFFPFNPSLWFFYFAAFDATDFSWARPLTRQWLGCCPLCHCCATTGHEAEIIFALLLRFRIVNHHSPSKATLCCAFHQHGALSVVLGIKL